MLQLALLGRPSVYLNGKPITDFVSDKALVLLCYLAVEPAKHSRETLATLLWGEMEDDRAKANLRMALYNLNKLVPGYVRSDRKTAVFVTEQPHAVDVITFAELVEKADAAAHWQTATTLYRGEFLSGIAIDDAPELTDWLRMRREHYHQQALAIFESLAEQRIAHGVWNEAITAVRRLLTLEPWREAAHQQLMRLLAHTGDINGALVQYKACQQILAAELGLEPSAETAGLAVRIRRSRIRRTALPFQPTPLQGRTAELGQLHQWLIEPTCRLITIGGQGGTGKTRLAIQCAADHGYYFLDGIVFIPLASVTDKAELVSTIAAALNLSLTGDSEPWEQLLDFLRHKEMLLVLDNMEQIVGAGAELTVTLLEQTTAINCLVTSREFLNVRWEYRLPLIGLAYPTDEADHSTDYAALQLFAETARQVQPSFELAAHQLDVVAICRLLEGLPLGIELAAARTYQFACADIAQAISKNLDVLATQQREIPTAHRSLGAVFTYSWSLLTSAEQAVLAALSVFRGGFTAEAAEAIAAATVPQLSQLILKSLVQRNGESRYNLHEVIRYFAAEKLAVDSEQEAHIQHQHAHSFMAFLQAREVLLMGVEQKRVKAEINADLDNIRQGWRWAAANGRSDTLAEGAEGLYQFFFSSGRFQEGEALFRMAAETVKETADPLILWSLQLKQADCLYELIQLEQAQTLVEAILAEILSQTPLTPALRTLARQAHLQAAALTNVQGDFEDAHTHLQAVFNLSTEEETDLATAKAHKWLGQIYSTRGNIPQSDHHFLQAVEQFTALGHLFYLIESMARLGMNAFGVGPRQRALDWFEKALTLAREVDNQFHQGRLLTSIAGIYPMQGEYSRARTALLEAIKLAEGLHDSAGESVARHNLGVLLSRLGRYTEAAEQYEQDLRFRRIAAEPYGLILVLLNYGLLYKHQEDYAQALIYHEEALEISRTNRIQTLEGLAWARLGQDYEGLKRLGKAQEAYEKALAIHNQLEQRYWAIEVEAGLARVALAEDQLKVAQGRVETILSYLTEESLAGAREYFLVHWSCYQVLKAIGDGRATQFLARTYAELEARADKIPEADLRRSYLEDVSFHRAIVTEATRQSKEPSCPSPNECFLSPDDQ